MKHLFIFFAMMLSFSSHAENNNFRFICHGTVLVTLPNGTVVWDQQTKISRLNTSTNIRLNVLGYHFTIKKDGCYSISGHDFYVERCSKTGGSFIDQINFNEETFMNKNNSIMLLCETIDLS